MPRFPGLIHEAQPLWSLGEIETFCTLHLDPGATQHSIPYSRTINIHFLLETSMIGNFSRHGNRENDYQIKKKSFDLLSKSPKVFLKKCTERS